MEPLLKITFGNTLNKNLHIDKLNHILKINLEPIALLTEKSGVLVYPTKWSSHFKGHRQELSGQLRGDGVMTNKRPNGHGEGGRTMRPGETNSKSDLISQVVSIDVERSGDWMPVEDLRTAAQEAVAEGANVTLNLHKVDHLDASALQVLLALDIEQKKQGRNLQLTNASPQLRQWFEFAGVADLFSIGERRGE